MKLLKQILKRIAIFMLPIDSKKIVFCNFNGSGYGCNPKYIVQELINRSCNYKYVWLTNDMDDKMPSQIRKVNYRSWKAKIEMITAKMWVFNTRNYKGIDKRDNQLYIQTWHSSVGLKKVEGDIKNRSAFEKKESMYDGSITDLMFANNEFRIEQIRRAFWYDGELIKCGIPRNSVLFNTSKEIKAKVRNTYEIDPKVKIVLYAPTFRTSDSVNTYIWDYSKICYALQSRFGSEVVMLLRLHPNIANQSSQIVYDDRIKNASFYPDMQELLAVSDYLITDFSSCAFDFSFTYKPVFLFAKDKQDYIKNERELLLSINELPYTIAESVEELEGHIRNFSEDIYISSCREFFNKIGLKENGDGASVVADWIEKHM